MTAVLLADSGVSLSPRHPQDTWTMVDQQIHFELSSEPALSPSARMMVSERMITRRNCSSVFWVKHLHWNSVVF